MSGARAVRDLLARVAGEYAPAALASSLSAEDMVLADVIARDALPIEIFVLETGRLHGDTLDLIGLLERRYGLEVRTYRPLAEAVRRYEADYGRDAFYESRELRQRCCEIRKVEPLRRALEGKRAWITGLRRAQSSARADLPLAAFDAAFNVAKFNPLAEWSEAEVWAYLREHKVPYNALHDRGFPSIGCAPCTRAVAPGEDPRAGRWWWEQDGKKECGLHVNGDRPHFPVRVTNA